MGHASPRPQKNQSRLPKVGYRLTSGDGKLHHLRPRSLELLVQLRVHSVASHDQDDVDTESLHGLLVDVELGGG